MTEFEMELLKRLDVVIAILSKAKREEPSVATEIEKLMLGELKCEWQNDYTKDPVFTTIALNRFYSAGIKTVGQLLGMPRKDAREFMGITYTKDRWLKWCRLKGIPW